MTVMVILFLLFLAVVVWWVFAEVGTIDLDDDPWTISPRDWEADDDA